MTLATTHKIINIRIGFCDGKPIDQRARWTRILDMAVIELVIIGIVGGVALNVWMGNYASPPEMVTHG